MNTKEGLLSKRNLDILMVLSVLLGSLFILGFMISGVVMIFGFMEDNFFLRLFGLAIITDALIFLWVLFIYSICYGVDIK